MVPKLQLIVTFTILVYQSVSPFGIGKREGLYGPEDVGILNLETVNFTSTIVGSKSAFIVEFYSSYCGHCINFAPHFKEFARQVADWSPIIKVGAIDCAQDVNMPICRDYEIMGYPTLKFFPVNTNKNDLGELRQSHSKEVQEIISDMLDYLQRIEGNLTLSSYTKHWPKLDPLRIKNVNEIWSSGTEKAQFAIFVFDQDSNSPFGRQLLLDVGTKIKDNSIPVIIRRVIGASEAGQSLMKQLGVLAKRRFPLVVAVNRKHPDRVDILWEGGETSRMELARVINNFIWKNTDSIAGSVTDRPKKKDHLSKQVSNKDELVPHQIINESEIQRRRYTVHMADLENAIIYALTHEVAQRAVISDKALTSLQSFLEVLVKYFPGREKTRKFLEELKVFVRNHDDMLRGEDLQDKITNLRVETGAFSDLGKEWIGCRGSKPMYGGYPCSLWSLWHTLTASQVTKANAKEDHDPKEVLRAMVSYIDIYFGCRECARHFLLVAEDGKAIEREINNSQMSLLWLWKAHNKANRRLSGDLTDDPAFPKEVFPNKQHCTHCYNEQLGTDLWTEFHLDNVGKFLLDLYSDENISLRGLTDTHDRVGKKHESHDLILLEQSDKTNFSAEENQAAWGLFFSPIDISLCFGVYILSAIILILVYLKFVAKKKFGHIFSTIFHRRRNGSSPHPMSSKV